MSGAVDAPGSPTTDAKEPSSQSFLNSPSGADQTGSGTENTAKSSTQPDSSAQSSVEPSLENSSTNPTDPSTEKGLSRNVDSDLTVETDLSQDTNETKEVDSTEQPKEEGEIGPQPATPSENADSDMLALEDDSSAGDAVGMGDDMLDWLSDGDRESKRVKVYELVGSSWEDQGTAFCTGVIQDETGEAFLVARAEKDSSNIILSTGIKQNDVYQRQQETLIVWTEPDGVDYALSFQDPDGCSEVWNFIQEVQRHMNASEDSAFSSSSPTIGPTQPLQPGKVTTATIIRSGQLPAPTLGIIPEVEAAIRQLGRTQALKERICEYILSEDYIKQLIDVMSIAEDLESLENLHALCSIMQTIFMLNDHNLYEHILEDHLFMGVIGMLEYDPEFPTHKANYREFLNQSSHFHQPVRFKDEMIQRKIHHTYRLQFLKDVVLARTIDDSTFNVLNSCILFNQIDIISHVQSDTDFLREVTQLFVDDRIFASLALLKSAQGQPSGPTTVSLNGSKETNDVKMDVDGDNKKEGDTSAAESSSSDDKTAKPNGHSLPLLAEATKADEPIGPRRTFVPVDELTPDEVALRKEVILLIQQLCVMGKNVQLPARMQLFRSLVDRGILFAVQWALSLPDKDPIEPPSVSERSTEEAETHSSSVKQNPMHMSLNMISAAGEILSTLLDHDLLGVRNHVLKQIAVNDARLEAAKKSGQNPSKPDETLLLMLCRLMATGRELSVQSIVGDSLKTWLEVTQDSPTLSAGGEAGARLSTGGKKDEPSNERFLDYFYKNCAQVLLKPLNDLPEWRNFTDPVFTLPREMTNRYLYLCDLLYNFSVQHHFRSYLFVMSTNIFVRVATLLKVRDKHLLHAAFRFFRHLLKQNNPALHFQLMKHDVLQPILDLTLRESRRDTLLSCSCQEFFEHMRRENMKEMIKFCMQKHGAEIRKLAETPLGGERFKNLIQRHEMNEEPPPKDAAIDRPTEIRRPGPGRAVDKEEEDYFLGDDNEDDFVMPISHQHTRSASIGNSPTPSLKRKRRMPSLGSSPSVKGSSFQPQRPLTPTRSPMDALGALSDYSDDEEDAAGEPDPDFKNQIAAGKKATTTTTSPMLRKLKSAFRFQAGANGTSQSSQSSTSKGQTSASSLALPERKPASDEDEEDNLLESLVRVKSRPESPGPGLMASLTALGPERPEKRRKVDDDDEDELLEKISSKSKKADSGSEKDGPAPNSNTRTKQGDDPPKKMQVKLGAVGLKVASAALSPEPSKPDVEDGDTG